MLPGAYPPTYFAFFLTRLTAFLLVFLLAPPAPGSGHSACVERFFNALPIKVAHPSSSLAVEFAAGFALDFARFLRAAI